jgi:chromosome segregation ATPase
LVKKCTFHIEAEKQLKAQLSVYTQKYEEFQSTLTKSNQVFESFRTEMDKMTKKMKRLDQETNAWKSKFESTNKKLTLINEQVPLFSSFDSMKMIFLF